MKIMRACDSDLFLHAGVEVDDAEQAIHQVHAVHLKIHLLKIGSGVLMSVMVSL